jgi:hypothetical protein
MDNPSWTSNLILLRDFLICPKEAKELTRVEGKKEKEWQWLVYCGPLL